MLYIVEREKILPGQSMEIHQDGLSFSNSLLMMEWQAEGTELISTGNYIPTQELLADATQHSEMYVVLILESI